MAALSAGSKEEPEAEVAATPPRKAIMPIEFPDNEIGAQGSEPPNAYEVLLQAVCPKLTLSEVPREHEAFLDYVKDQVTKTHLDAVLAQNNLPLQLTKAKREKLEQLLNFIKGK